MGWEVRCSALSAAAPMQQVCQVWGEPHPFLEGSSRAQAAAGGVCAVRLWLMLGDNAAEAGIQSTEGQEQGRGKKRGLGWSWRRLTLTSPQIFLEVPPFSSRFLPALQLAAGPSMWLPNTLLASHRQPPVPSAPTVRQ